LIIFAFKSSIKLNYLSKNIRFLRKSKQMSQEDVAELLHLQKSSISGYEKGINPKLDKLIQIADIFGVIVDDLLRTDLEKTSKNDRLQTGNILVPIKAQAGYLTDFFTDETSNIQYLELPFFNTFGQKRTFQVEGRSMQPTFEGGDYVVCELVEAPTHVKDKHYYVFVSQDDGVVLKSVFNDKKRKYYQLISDNPDYPPIIRHWEEIKEVWEVKYRIIRCK